VGANLVILGWFKYYGFFARSFVNMMNDFGVDASAPLVEVILPVGISFFTFQAISYLVDIGRREAQPVPLLEFATYLSFFPYLTAGPITRIGEFAPQMGHRAVFQSIPFGEALLLITLGLFKKVVISTYLSTSIVDQVFGNPTSHSSQELIVAVYAYSAQIYADFSGYSDIAIGTALLLGFRLPQNFDDPYRSLSLREFWRRWHMTLSRWLRDYVFIPLGGSRGGTGETYRNLMVTMLLGGLWHGAAMRFLVWGGLHGGGLVAERAIDRRAGASSRATPVLRWLITFNFVCFAWIFFRADSVGTAFEMIGRMFTAWGSSPLIEPLIILTIVVVVSFKLVPENAIRSLEQRLDRMGTLAQAAVLAGALLLVNYLGPEGVAPFIYYQF
jgi:D-alanyl-lipoteichoic acid acyltransferase DltB (MBOAT superfamily)